MFNIFNNGHEICHDLVPGVSGFWKDLFLHIGCLPDITPLIYYYFRWGHVSHHMHLGEQSTNMVWNLKRAQDADTMSHLVRLYALRPALQKSASFRYGILHPILTVIILCIIAPPLEALTVFVMSMPLSLFHFVRQGLKNNLALRKMCGLIFHTLLMWTSLYFLFQIGGWKSILYLILSHLFFEGFLMHPLLAYWITVHKTNSNDGPISECQPTTSIYGKAISWICLNQNYHVEHHDFPNVPVYRLDELHNIASEFYTTIPHHNGIFNTFYQYFVHQKTWIYACH